MVGGLLDILDPKSKPQAQKFAQFSRNSIFATFPIQAKKPLRVFNAKAVNDVIQIGICLGIRWGEIKCGYESYAGDIILFIFFNPLMHATRHSLTSIFCATCKRAKEFRLTSWLSAGTPGMFCLIKGATLDLLLSSHN